MLFQRTRSVKAKPAPAQPGQQWSNVIGRDARALRYAPKQDKNDRKNALAAVRQDGDQIQHISGDIAEDRDVALAAVQSKGSAIRFLTAELADDAEIALAAVSRDGLAYQFVSRRLRDDRDIILAALRQNGMSLALLSRTVRDNPTYTLEAVRQCGLALQFAAPELKRNRNIVREAVQQDAGALKYAHPDFRDDTDMVLQGLEKNGQAMQHASKVLRNDKNFVLKAMETDVMALSSADKTLRGDRDFMLQSMKKNRMALEFAAGGLKRDSGMHAAAIEQDSSPQLRHYLNWMPKVRASSKHVDVYGNAARHRKIAPVAAPVAAWGAELKIDTAEVEEDDFLTVLHKRSIAGTPTGSGAPPSREGLGSRGGGSRGVMTPTGLGGTPSSRKGQLIGLRPSASDPMFDGRVGSRPGTGSEASAWQGRPGRGTSGVSLATAPLSPLSGGWVGRPPSSGLLQRPGDRGL